MCGICGELFFNNDPANTLAAEKMNSAMLSRGPDHGGTFAANWVALGQRRLKIIDLSDDSNQPFIDRELGIALVFNGAIYNYKELRRELQDKGYTFRSSGDTEVISKAYHAWGDRCVDRFNGMFAFVVYDMKKDLVVLARDRLGIKPLYYHETGQGLTFASTLPAILASENLSPEISPRALHHYMSFHAVVPAPHTVVEGIRKLPQATVMTVKPNGTTTVRKYWDLTFHRDAEEEGYGFDDWKELLSHTLMDSVRRRLVADVPVGVLLSGGLDSSLIVGLLAEAGQTRLSTFSVGFESAGGEQGDEFEYSDLIARHFGTDHHQIRVGSEELLDTMPACVRAMSEPMVSHDCIGFYLLSREVSQHVKVVQSGQGADEVFGGYHWYPPMQDSQDPVRDYRSVFFDRSHAEFLDVVHDPFRGKDVSTAFVAEHFSRPGTKTPLDKALKLDTTVMLVEDPVKRVDNMTMAWGLEARVPFLDHTLVELAAKIPGKFKVGNGGKSILKEAARGVIPSKVIDRPKGYFPVPALKYIQGPYLKFVDNIVKSDACRNRGLIREEYIARLLAAPERHITPLKGSKLWQVALLEFWLQQNGM